MTSDKSCILITISLVCLFLLVPGCGKSAKHTTGTEEQVVKRVETKVEPEKAVEKAVETKVEPEKVVETKVEAETVVETKVEAVKAVEPKVEPEPEKVVETKVEVEKAVETKVMAEEAKPAVDLVLKFEPNDVSTYKVVMAAQKSVLWEGPAPSKPSAFKGGETSNRSEMTFSQEIKSVGDDGSAIAVITIKKLKYLAKVRDEVAIDFDSSREKDKSDPLHKLIGQGYTIKITPAGQVAAVIGTKDALVAIVGNAPTAKTARSLVGGNVIKQRHSIPGMPAADTGKVSTGGKWSALRTFDFGMLGSRSYERVYELAGIEDSGKGKVAVAKMNAVPSAEGAAEMHKGQSAGFLSKLFDNTEEYTGELTLDVTSGKVAKYREELKSEWLAVDPESGKKPDEAPAALRMTALRLYEIVRID